MKKVALTGPPGCGKTTLIKNILSRTSVTARGFITEELKENDRRVGFLARSLSNKKTILAQKGIKTEKRLGSYGLFLKDFENLILPDIFPPYIKDELIIVDEIGKMECFSKLFCRLVEEIIGSDTQLLATLGLQNHPFLNKIRQNSDIMIYEVSLENKEDILKKVLDLF